MRKFIGLAVLPVLLAGSPLLAIAEQPVKPVAPTTQTKQIETTQVQTRTQVKRDASGKETVTQQKTAQTMTSTRPAAASNQQGTEFAQAQVNLINRQYPEAVTAFKSILYSQPDNVPALNSLASGLYHQGHYAEALEAIEKAIALDPVNSGLFYTQAKILDAQNKPMEALQSYLTFTAMNPDDAAAMDAQFRAGELYRMAEGKLSEAQQNLFQGQRLLSLRQPSQAIPLFQKYKTLSPNDSKADLMLGQAYLEMGQPEKAIPQFESAVKLKADNAAAYYHLGTSYDIQGQPQNAEQAYQQFLKLAPQSESAMLLNKRVDMK